MWLKLPAGKMKRMLCLVGLPLAIPCFDSARKSSVPSHMLNPLLTRLAWSRWLEIALVRFCVVIDLDLASSIKTPNKGIWPISSNLNLKLEHDNNYFVSIDRLFQRWTWRGANFSDSHYKVSSWKVSSLLPRNRKEASQTSSSRMHCGENHRWRYSATRKKGGKFYEHWWRGRFRYVH